MLAGGDGLRNLAVGVQNGRELLGFGRSIMRAELNRAGPAGFGNHRAGSVRSGLKPG